MRDREPAAADICIFCGEELEADDPHTFVLGDERKICFGCAKMQGGLYDPSDETWVVPPYLEVADTEAS